MSFPRTVVSLSYYDKNSTKRVGLVQSRHHLIKMYFVLAMIDLKNCLLEVRQQSLAHYYEVYKGCCLCSVLDKNNYIQTCIKGSPLGQRNIGLLRQMTD
jgi:hypothetical protein